MGTLSISGTEILYDGQPYYFQGLTFFNALYNTAFNQSDEERRRHLKYLKSWGFTMMRVWGDWRTQNGWIDEGPDQSLWVYPVMEGRNRLFEPQGIIDTKPLERLKTMLTIADELEMVVELALFTHYQVYPVRTRDEWLQRITKELKPWRNCIFEVWNEYDDHTLRHYETIKLEDPDRIVTNSPGGSDTLGRHLENSVLDMLAPHTYRRGVGNFWDIAPDQIKYLLDRYQKPILDDEPARTGTPNFGGNPESQTEQHIIHMDRVRENGGYSLYHPDMFQTGYGSKPVPLLGIPDPTYSPFHQPIFEHIRDLAPDSVKNG